MIGFSMVLMSRSRAALLENLILSIQKTSYLDNEIIVGLDSDDPELELYKNLEKKYKNIILNIQSRNSNLHIRINNMIQYIRGKYIFALNDDCILTNISWDKQAFDILDNCGEIIYGRTYDNSIDRVNDEYAAFPIISKVAAIKLGFIIDDTYGNHGADVTTYRIYNEANKVIDLKCVQIDHVFHNSIEALQNRLSDKTAVDMIHRTYAAGFNINDLFSINLSHKVNKII